MKGTPGGTGIGYSGKCHSRQDLRVSPDTEGMGLAAARLQLVFPQEDFKELGKKETLLCK